MVLGLFSWVSLCARSDDLTRHLTRLNRPNFETLKNKDAWDVADVVILEDDED